MVLGDLARARQRKKANRAKMAVSPMDTAIPAIVPGASRDAEKDVVFVGVGDGVEAAEGVEGVNIDDDVELSSVRGSLNMGELEVYCM